MPFFTEFNALKLPFSAVTVRLRKSVVKAASANATSDGELTRVGTFPSGGSWLSLTVTALNGSFSALNSVKNGINPSPLQTTGGEGAVRGVEFLFDAVLKSP